MLIRVLVATAARAYREGLQRLLQGAEGIALVGVASTAENAIEQACKLLPSVILLDVAMANSLALARQFAGTPKVCGMVVLGAPESYGDVIACLPSEVLAFVAREATVGDLVTAIRAAGSREPLARVITVPIPAHHPAIAHLTEREMEILRLMQQGLPNKMISRRLGIELSTVKNHVHSILAKLGVHNRGEAISMLYRYESSRAEVVPLEQPAVA